MSPDARKSGGPGEAAPVPAASVLLLRDNPDDTPPLEVLMVERHADIGFAGGALVFPGGRIDPGDRNPAWADFADGWPTDEITASAMVAAAREAFEETGLLLARAADDAALVDGERTLALDRRRAEIEADDALFIEMVRAEKLRLALDQLSLFARWIAPPGLHKRFDTWFFCAAMPAGQVAREDGNEATEALWITPKAALAARAEGSRKMIFPTARNVELLGRSACAADVVRYAATRAIEPITPAIVRRGDGAVLTIPDHLGYPVTEEALESASRG